MKVGMENPHGNVMRVLLDLGGEMSVVRVVCDVLNERQRQDAKWGEQNHPDGTGDDGWAGVGEIANCARNACDHAFATGGGTWRHIAMEEVAEAFAESDPAKLRVELVQAAAVLVAWVEAIDRREANHG